MPRILRTTRKGDPPKRSRNIAKLSKLANGTFTSRPFTLNEQQGELLRLYRLESDSPILGSSGAVGMLNIGKLAPKPNEPDFREPINVPFTRENMADHYGLFNPLWLFMDEVHQQAISIPNLVSVGAREQILKMLDETITIGVRKYLRKEGIEGVRCWLYVCPIIDAYADQNGNIGFKYGPQWPLAIVPRDPHAAMQKWKLSTDTICELALLAGYLVFYKFPAYKMYMTKKAMLNLFGGWKEFLPQPQEQLFEYLQSSSKQPRDAWLEE